MPRVLLSELSGKSSDINKGVQALQDNLDSIPPYQTRNIEREEQQLAMAKNHAARYMEILRSGHANFSALPLPATLLDAQTGKPTENGQAFLKVVCEKITFPQLKAAYRDIQRKLSELGRSKKGNHYKKTVRESNNSFLTSLKTSGFDTYTLEKLLNNEIPRGLKGSVEDAKK